MDLLLTNKCALVTGASMGIGRAIAKALAAEGARLAVVARRRNLLETLSQEIVAGGGAAPTLFEVDVMHDGAVQKLAKDALKALGGVDILVNSAGGSQPPIGIDAPDEAWDFAMT